MFHIKTVATSDAKPYAYTVKTAAIDADLYDDMDDTVASVGLVLMGFSALAVVALLGWFISVTVV